MRDSEDSGNIIKTPSNQDLAIKISFSDESVKATKLDEVTKFPNENNNKFTDSIIGTSTVVAAKTPPLGGDERSGQRCVSHISNLFTMRRDLLNNVLRLWAGIFLLNI